MNLLTRKLSHASVALVCTFFFSAALAQSAPAPASAQHKWALVLHGGAGVIARSSMSPEAEANYRAGIKEALTAAADVLDKGGSSLDAVEAAINFSGHVCASMIDGQWAIAPKQILICD